MVGSGNPEEGELRPQLLDRFGMHAEIRTVKDPSLRVDIVEQRTQFDSEPQKFYETYQNEQEKLQETLVKAQNLLPLVDIDSKIDIMEFKKIIDKKSDFKK